MSSYAEARQRTIQRTKDNFAAYELLKRLLSDGCFYEHDGVLLVGMCEDEPVPFTDAEKALLLRIKESA